MLYMDWIGTIFLCLSIWILGNKNKNGYVLNIISCIFFIIFSIQVNSIAMVLANSFVIVLCIRGYFKWENIKNA